MSANVSGFVNSRFPPSQENGFFGWVRRNVLGRFGKFNRAMNAFYPINPKMFLIDTSPGELMSVAMDHPHLNTILTTGARIFSMMEIRHVDKDGNDIENSEVLKLLKKPNPMQTQRQYLSAWYIMNGVYNKTFQYKNKGLSYKKLPAALQILPSGWMKINATGKIFRQTKLSDIITSYEMLNEVEPFTVDEVIYMVEGVGNNPLNPISKIQAQQIPLSNIMAALKSRNVILTSRGATGIIASDGGAGDGEGAIPMDEIESKKLRKEYKQKYSLDSDDGHVMFTHTNLKWIPMSFDISQLKLIEGLEDDFAALIASFMHDRDIYPSVKGATFENKQAGMKYTIQNGMQPLADVLMEQLTENIVDETIYGVGSRLIASYDKVPAMQADKLKAAQAKFFTVRSMSVAMHDGVINHDTYAEESDVEMTGDKKILPTTPQANNNENNTTTDEGK